jgi:hypothetical protein
MSPADGRGHYRAPLPPFIVIHQEHAQVTQGLFLCAVVICPWPKDPQGMTQEQAETVGVVQSQLIGDHLAGRFPDGDDYAFWLDMTTGAMTVLDNPSNHWLRGRRLDYLAVTLNVPRPMTGTENAR